MPEVKELTTVDFSERTGGCETCERAEAATFIFHAVRRDDRPESHTPRLCLDCASIIRHGSHEHWDGLVLLGDLTGRTISWRRPLDDSMHSGIVLGDAIQENMLSVWTPSSGVFRQLRRTVHRANIVNVWPLPAVDVSRLPVAREVAVA